MPLDQVHTLSDDEIRKLNKVTSLVSEVDLNRRLWSAAAAIADEVLAA